jgi:DNA mismatch repair protein MutS2
MTPESPQIPEEAWSPALEALEWGKIVARLSARAVSDPGRALCAGLAPGTDLEAIRLSLDENRDGRRMLAEEGPLPLEGLAEIGPPVENAVKGASLAASELLLAGGTARAGERVRRFFAERRDRYPRLARHARMLPRLREIADAIELAIDPSGDISDRASPALAAARRRLSEHRHRLQKGVEEMIASPRYARYIQEAYATVRSGRLVIPFKAQAKGLFQGIVHDTSQSGQTVFFEPEELVRLNNDVRMAEIDVEREIARILAELSGKVARTAEELLLCRDVLARLDFAQARSLLAEELAAAEALVDASGEVGLVAARHPLLVLARKEVVPNDLRLGPPYRCLILTGPNAGGKTVALKTLGLLTVMAMAGLSIPASGDSALSVFSRIFVSLGDEQSVERDLSTYSAHIRRLNEILAGADERSLVLLDEVVSGTDPQEGAAIARAFLEALADRGVRVLATTHFDELKRIAFEDPRFENASMEFDASRLRPTYRLHLGVPGRSMGMEIARALEFPEEILARARTYLSEPGQRLDEVLARLEAERKKTAAEAAALGERRREAEESRRRLEAERARAREEEAKALAQSRLKIREEIRKAEAQLRAVAEEARRERKAEAVRRGQAVLGEWKARAAGGGEDPAARAMMSRTAPPAPEALLFQGQRVFLTSLGREAEVASPSPPGSREVEVAAGGLSLRVPRDDVRVFPAPPEAAAKAAPRSARGGAAPGAFIQTPGNTLDIRGYYVDDALPEVDAFLDRMALSQAPHAFVVHGHGTGALKAGVRRHLKASPYVKRFFPAPREQGGDGATIILLT